MNRQTAIKNLKELVPGHDFCICLSNWCWEDGSRIEVEYRVSVLPGLNGKECQQFQADSLEGVVAAVAQQVEQLRYETVENQHDEAFMS